MLLKVKKLAEPCGWPRAFGPASGKGHTGPMFPRKKLMAICDRHDMRLGGEKGWTKGKDTN